MKNLILFMAALVMAFVFQSCTKQADSPVGEIIASEKGVEATNSVDLSKVDFRAFFQNHEMEASRGTTSTTDVYTNDMASLMVDGSSTIHRNHNKVTLSMEAHDAPNLDVTGHACTLWALVWHSADEAFSGAFPYAMYRVGGNVCDGNTSDINGVVKEGEDGADYYNTNFSYVDPDSGETVVIYDGSMPLDDAETAFIVTIVKSHGMMDPTQMPGQIHTFEGGCEDDPDSGGPLGPCSEYVYSIHF